MAACVPALLQVVTLVRVLASRISYPMDVEWMEGGSLLHAYRLLEGQPIYASPDSGFLPFSYPPGHFALLALLGSVFKLDYVLGRVVSIAAIVTAAFVLAREVFRAYRPVTGHGCAWALLAVGWIAAGFPLCGGWYDIIRTDSLALGLAVVAAALAEAESRSEHAHRGRSALFVLTLALLPFVKQQCVVYAAWLAVFVMVLRPKRGLLLAAAAGVVSLTALASMQLLTKGLYWHYTVTLLSHHPIFEATLDAGVRGVSSFAPFLVGLPVMAAVAWLYGRLSRRSVLWLGLLMASLPLALWAAAKQGGYINNFLPVAVLAGPTALLVACDFVRVLPARSPAAGAFTLMLGLSSGYMLHERRFRVEDYAVPGPQHDAAKALNVYVQRLGPSVLIPDFPFLALRNHSTVHQIHAMAWIDAAWAGAPVLSFSELLARQKPRHVMLTNTEYPLVPDAVGESYVFTERVPPLESQARTVVNRVQLSILASLPSPKSAERMLFDFEENGFAGWHQTGNAFNSGPTLATPPNQCRIRGIHGQRVANSFHGMERDGSTGTLLSPPFVIDRSRLSLRVGGGSGAGTRVELRVDDRVVYTANGHDSEHLREVIWDVSSLSGRTARMAAIDLSPGAWGHILLDAVVLFEPVPEPPPAARVSRR